MLRRLLLYHFLNLVCVAPLIALPGTLFSCAERDAEISGIVRVKDFKLGSRVGGMVKEILVEEGASVKAGQALVVLDSDKLIAQRRILEESLAQAEAQYKRLVEGATPEEIARAKAELTAAEAQYRKALSGFRSEDIAMAREKVKSLEARFTLAEKEAKRASALFETGVISLSQLEKANAERDALQSELESARQNLEKLTAGLEREDIESAKAAVEARRAILLNLKKGATKNDLAAAEAAVKKIKAEIARLELDIQDCIVRAPVSGDVEELSLEVGEIAAPGSPIVSLLCSEDMWIDVYLPMSLLGSVQIGGRLRVVADAMPHKPFFGEVFFISREAQFTPRNIFTPEQRINQVYLVKLKPVEPPIALRGGLTVSVFVPRNE